MIAHTSTDFHFTVDLSYDDAAPLFGALEEQKWAPGWKPEFLYPTPAVDEEGSVFRVQKGEHSSLWVNTVFDLARGHVQYVYVLADLLITRIDIRIQSGGPTKTDVSVIYERTALTPSANDHVKSLAREDSTSGEEWRSLINTYAASVKRSLNLYNRPVDLHLNAVEARVLGALVEKDITTPDYYPLSLNALVNACNQKNNREPVMSLDENAVRDALEGLQQRNLAGPARGADSRVTKYEHRLQEAFNFTRGETAIVRVLLLRGPQTPGELRGRTERMFRFETLDDVQSTLQRLMQRDHPLAKVLPRQPGTKEARYMHLFSGDVEEVSVPPTSSSASAVTEHDTGRLASLEEEVHELRREVADLKEQIASFRRQFE